MAALVILGLVTIVIGAGLGTFLALSFAIRREDRTRGSLQCDAPSSSARAARALVGTSGSTRE